MLLLSHLTCFANSKVSIPDSYIVYQLFFLFLKPW